MGILSERPDVELSSEKRVGGLSAVALTLIVAVVLVTLRGLTPPPASPERVDSPELGGSDYREPTPPSAVGEGDDEFEVLRKLGAPNHTEEQLIGTVQVRRLHFLALGTVITLVDGKVQLQASATGSS
ncbi:MAG: hypothetical protein IPM79_17890 [Polyangiaceae bacterium]|jgi:hypothetical protein|nr:hypothetical protein [Polyangiaceae bacterium]MBK8939440.1 hypothetical protein [Polyangiaceae bacterium]